MNIPVYREQFQEALKEITRNGGKIHKIYNNLIYFYDGTADCVFVPEMTAGGPMFFKKNEHEFNQA